MRERMDWAEAAGRPLHTRSPSASYVPGHEAIVSYAQADVETDPEEQARASRWVRRTEKTDEARDEVLDVLGLPGGPRLTPWPKDLADREQAAVCLAEARTDVLHVVVPEPEPEVEPTPAEKPPPHRRAPTPRMDVSWHDWAACKNLPLTTFFAPDGERQPERDVREARAKAICEGCPVDVECRDYAVGRPEKSGVWGQMNEEERAAERRRRQRRAATDARRWAAEEAEEQAVAS